MNAWIVWNPFKELTALRHGSGGVFGRARVHLPEDQEEQPTLPQRAPFVDILEGHTEYLITVELPEVRKEDAQVVTEEGALVITGDRQFEQNRKRGCPEQCTEGRFSHRFVLPADARPAKVSVVFEHEILSVHLAKHAAFHDRLTHDWNATHPFHFRSAPAK